MEEITELIIKTKPKLAFVGTGWIGLSRMKSLIEEDICTPVAILDNIPENAKKAQALCKSADTFSSIDAVIESKPDGIVIATPSALHYRQSIAALEAGIPVFCQKPLARNAAESKSIIETARETDRLLGVDLSYRFTDGMQKIYELTRNNHLGKIYAVDLVFHNAYGPDKDWFYDPKLSGGGCLIDLGVHLVDLALWILNFPEVTNIASSLFSKGEKIYDIRKTTEDFAAAQFETADGVLIRITCSWNLSAGKDAEIKAAFYGTNASAIFSNTRGSFFDFKTWLCYGTKSEIISSPPDDWGGQALIDWTKKLQQSNKFDEEINSYGKVAEIIDRIYGRKKMAYENIYDYR